jgi:hypothetical protein
MREGPSRPKAVTGRGLPPNDSCERWPTASGPQPTSSPAGRAQRDVGGRAPRQQGARAIGLGTPGGIQPDRERSAIRTRGGDGRTSCRFRDAKRGVAVHSRSGPP